MAGRPPKLTTVQIGALVARRRDNVSYEQIAEEAKAGKLGLRGFDVHPDTVREHCPDTPQIDQDVSPKFSEIGAMLRAKSEANLEQMNEAIEKEDWARVDRLMKARGALTQGIKGFLASRDLYREPKQGEQRGPQERTFLAGLAQGYGVERQADEGGDREQGAGRADARVDEGDGGAHAPVIETDLHTDHVDEAA